MAYILKTGVRCHLIFSLSSTTGVYFTPSPWWYAKNIQTLYHNLLNSTLQFLCSTSKPWPFKPFCQTAHYLWKCKYTSPLCAVILQGSSLVRSEFICTAALKGFPQIIHEITGTDFKPPLPFFFYLQNILPNVYAYILKSTEKVFQDSKDVKHLQNALWVSIKIGKHSTANWNQMLGMFTFSIWQVRMSFVF